VDKEKANKMGKIVFCVVSALVLVYSWWLVIYNHGVASSH
tara:strand:- start:203 stop:322 length:120 start_codon:yes stop_codon:yes gene_type:complete